MDHYDKIAKAIGYIQQQYKEQPSLEEIADHVSMSPFHFQRIFSEWAGISPKKFIQFLTLEYVKSMLTKDISLLQASFESGLSGTGRLHDLFVTIEGMTPGEYRNGGMNLTIRFGIYPSIFGRYVTASTSKGICNLFFLDDPDQAIFMLKNEWPRAKITEEQDLLHEKVKQFFEMGLKNKARINLHIHGSPFQLKIWRALLQIPEGKLTTYQAIAGYTGYPQAQRATGAAIGKNPVAYLIPCHRVIKSTGLPGGYRWDVIRKQAIIGWEAARTEKLSTG